MHERSLTQGRLLLGSSMLLSVLLSFSGADSDTLGHRALELLFWFLHVAIGLGLMGLVTRCLERGPIRRLPDWMRLLVGGGVGALTFAPIAVALEHVFAPVGLSELDVQAFSWTQLPKDIGHEFSALSLPFVASWLLLNLGYQRFNAGAFDLQPAEETGTKTAVGAELGTGIEPRPTATATPLAAPLLAQLPTALGTDILLLQSDLNYLHVYTPAGRAMVLYSLARAVAELGDAGTQVHRAYWVANHAVACLRRSPNGWSIVLTNAMEVPVSRRRQKAVLAAFGNGYRGNQLSNR